MAAPRRGAASRAQQSSHGTLIALAGLLGGAGIAYLHYPGVAVLWLALIVAAWVEPPAIMTGKKDSSGFPTPAHPGEEKNLRRNRFWRMLKFRLVVPNTSWLPGWPPLMVFAAAGVLATAAWCLPVSGIPYGSEINAAAAFIITMTVTAARRANMVEGPGCPGTRVTAVPKLFTLRGFLVIGAGLLAAAAAAWAVMMFVPVRGEWHLAIRPLGIGAAAATAFVIVVAHPLKTAALARWRMLTEFGALWDQRWTQIKIDPPPRLLDHREVGQATVDEFAAPSSLGSQAFWSIAPKIAPAVGAGMKVCILEMPDIDRTGQPVAGSRHPLNFQVVTWPSTDLPDLTDPGLDPDLAKLFARCAFAWTTESLGYGRPVLLSMEPLFTTDSPEPEPAPPHEDGTPVQVTPQPATAAWGTTWAFPVGPTLEQIRPLVGDLTGSFGSAVLIDHRAHNALFVGALTEPTTNYAPGGLSAEFMEGLALEDQWVSIWTQVMKMGANPPTLQLPTRKELQIGGSRGMAPVGLTRIGFTTRIGMDPADFRGMESKLATALRAAPFVSVYGWPAPGQPAGTRHPQAFGIIWSDGPVPVSPAELPFEEASQWILGGRINAAFDAARLARPEVASARVLTKTTARSHIWEITVRLYGGVTLSDVRGQASRIKGALSAPWLRIAPHEFGCTIFVGQQPAKAQLADPRKDALRLKKLDWDQGFVEAKITGNNGLLAELKKADVLPNNDKVEVLDFLLPPGMDLLKVRAGLKVLGVATGNAFLDVRPGVNGAASMRLLACTEDPMPTRVDYDFNHVGQGIPFATGIDGEALELDFADNPHVMVAGSSGGGKSVAGQALLYGALASGADIAMIDIQKQGADFSFAKPHTIAFAVTVREAAATMEALYAEVRRRAELNGRHGAGSTKDLPEDLRPNRIVLFIDEFLGVIMAGTKPGRQPEDDPERERERLEKVELYNARKRIGFLSGRIAAEARSADVHLVLMTQKLITSILDDDLRDLKVNLARILLGKATPGDRMSALRDPENVPTLGEVVPKGRGVWESVVDGGKAAQFWFGTQDQYGAHLLSQREPIAPDRMLDIEPFMPKRFDSSDVAGEIIEGSESFGAPDRPKTMNSDTASDVVVDVAEMSFDLGDLELDDLELDGVHADDRDLDDPVGNDTSTTADGSFDDQPAQPDEAVSFDKPAAEAPTDADVMVFLDVDGVLSPLGLPDEDWADWEMADGGPSGSALVSRQMIDRLAALPASIGWLTAWTDDALAAFPVLAEHEGRPTPVLAPQPDALPNETALLTDTGLSPAAGLWWKTSSLLSWLAEHPGSRKLVWVDDEFDELEATGVDRGTAAEDLLSGMGIEHLLVRSDADSGMSPAQVRAIERFTGAASSEPGAEDPFADDASAATLSPETPISEPAAEDPFADDASAATLSPETPISEPAADDPWVTVTPPAPAPAPARHRSVETTEEDDPFAEPASAVSARPGRTKVPARSGPILTDEEDPFA